MNKISTKHLMLFFIGVMFISIKTYPSYFINIGGRDTWICALIASLLFVTYCTYLIHVMKKHNTYNIIEIYKRTLPKPISMFFIILLAIAFFISSIEAAAINASVLKIQYFLDTPIWYIILFFLMPTVILLNKNIRTISVFIIISVSALILNSIIFLILIEKYKNLDFIFPILKDGINSDFILCTILIFSSLCTIFIAVPFMKYLDNGKYLKKHTFITTTSVTLFICFCILGVIAYFGPIRASNIFYPEAIQGQRVEIAGFFEFGEFFFIFQTVIGFLVKYLLSSYAFILLFKKLSKNRFLFIFIYTFLTFTFSSLISMNSYYLSQLLGIYNIINGIIFFIVPLFIFISFDIKNGMGKSKK